MQRRLPLVGRLLAGGALLVAACFAEAPPVESGATSTSTTSSSTTTDVASTSGVVPSTTGDVTTTDTSDAESSLSSSVSSSGTTGASCDEPGAVPEEWTPWSLMIVGAVDKPPPPCPGDVMPEEVLLLSDAEIRCGCDCGSHVEQCNIVALTSASGCGVAVTETDLTSVDCVALPAAAAHIDVTTQAPAGECNGMAVPAAGPDAVPVSVCALADDPQCDAQTRVCTTGAGPDCPEGTELLDVGRRVTCPACACTMGEWCTSARVEMFGDDSCDTPSDPAFVGPNDGCAGTTASPSMRAGDTRLGCFTDVTREGDALICCVP